MLGAVGVVCALAVIAWQFFSGSGVSSAAALPLALPMLAYGFSDDFKSFLRADTEELEELPNLGANGDDEEDMDEVVEMYEETPSLIESDEDASENMSREPVRHQGRLSPGERREPRF